MNNAARVNNQQTTMISFPSPYYTMKCAVADEPRPNGFVARLTGLIEANLDDEYYDITRLCRDAGASRTKIHNKLKHYTGFSTSKFIRAIRLRIAKRTLLNSDLNIAQVAYEVGFRDAHYFSRVFSESFGIPPKIYRQA